MSQPKSSHSNWKPKYFFIHPGDDPIICDWRDRETRGDPWEEDHYPVEMGIIKKKRFEVVDDLRPLYATAQLGMAGPSLYVELSKKDRKTLAEFGSLVAMKASMPKTTSKKASTSGAGVSSQARSKDVVASQTAAGETNQEPPRSVTPMTAFGHLRDEDENIVDIVELSSKGPEEASDHLGRAAKKSILADKAKHPGSETHPDGKKAQNSGAVDIQRLASEEGYHGLDNQNLASTLQQNLTLISYAAKADVRRMNAHLEADERYQSLLRKLKMEFAQSEKSKADACKEIADLRAQSGKVDKELKEAKSELSEAKYEAEEAKSGLETAMSELEGVKSENARLKKQVERSRAERESAGTKTILSCRKSDELKNDLNVLMLASIEYGYTMAVKDVKLINLDFDPNTWENS